MSEATRARSAILAVIAERENQLWPEDIKVLRSAEAVLAALERSENQAGRG